MTLPLSISASSASPGIAIHLQCHLPALNGGGWVADKDFLCGLPAAFVLASLLVRLYTISFSIG